MSKLSIYNQALGLMGHNAYLQTLDNKSDIVINTLDLFYDQTRKEILKNINWDFSKRTLPLTLFGSYSGSEYNPLGDQQLPVYGWKYSYIYPHDCVKAILIRPDDTGIELTGSDNTDEFRNVSDAFVPMSEGIEYDYLGNTTRVISTNKDKAVLIYNADIQDASLFTEEFIGVVALLLASKSTMGVLNNLQKSELLMKQSMAMVTQLKKKYDTKATRDLKPLVNRLNSDFINAKRWR